MIQEITLEPQWTLDDYAAIPALADRVRMLRAEAAVLAPALKDRTVWMVNSTGQGGGVAEMLPRLCSLLGEMGVKTRWKVMECDRPEFFRLTKNLHNLIHGEGTPQLEDGDRELYEAVNRDNAEALKPHLSPEDILVIHDPQPMGMGWMLKEELGLPTVWRCHIGHDEHLETTRAAWYFLKPYAEGYDSAVFSAPEYIPDFFAGRSTLIHPALDPFSHKNRELEPHKLVGVLCNAGLKEIHQPVLTPPFSAAAERLRPDGSFGPVLDQADIGLLYRPTVTQVSRWDRLKGFRPLMEGFVKLKRRLADDDNTWSARHRRRIEILRLVLAGPDPASVADDPEGMEVLSELISFYQSLEPDMQEDIALLSLPMGSRKENALMVNALQRCSTVVVQNSIREGFGLTATEAMFKRVPVLGTRASGLKQQIRSGIDGVITQDATDPQEIQRRLDDVLQNVAQRDQMSRNAQRRVYEKFLIFTQLVDWLHALSGCLSNASRRAHASRA